MPYITVESGKLTKEQKEELILYESFYYLRRIR